MLSNRIGWMSTSRSSKQPAVRPFLALGLGCVDFYFFLGVV